MLSLPLVSDVKQAVVVVNKMMSKLKYKFGEIYATYALSYYSCMFTPHFLITKLINVSTKPMTLVFSNTPGLIKPMVFEGQAKTSRQSPYIISPGKCGLSFSCISHGDHLTIQCLTDTAIMSDPSIFVNLIKANLDKCINDSKMPTP